MLPAITLATSRYCMTGPLECLYSHHMKMGLEQFEGTARKTKRHHDMQ